MINADAMRTGGGGVVRRRWCSMTIQESKKRSRIQGAAEAVGTMMQYVPARGGGYRTMICWNIYFHFIMMMGKSPSCI